MKSKSIIIICLAVSLFSVISYAGDYRFFNRNDIENIRNSAFTQWGSAVVEQMKSEIELRRQHSLRVPLLEGGHYHHYFCPVHNIMLAFDWDRPNEHWCLSCEKYWSGDNRYDWAWINGVHDRNLKYMKASMYMYFITGDTVYAGYIRDMMLDYASKYSTYFEHNTNRIAGGAWGGRMFGQSLDEAVWASDAARAYMSAKDVMTNEEITKIEGGYLRVCVRMLLDRRGAANWQVWHNCGLAALGVALGDSTIIETALNDRQCGYRKMMEENVYGDGWWGEGSPVYHYYPLRAILLTADAVRCVGIDLYDEKLYKMLASPAMGVYSDLAFPAHNDGWYGESLVDQAKLYEIAYKRYNDPFFLDILQQCYRHRERDSEEALLNSVTIEPAKKPMNLESANFENTGFAVLRSGDKSVVFKYGPHGGGHGHPDKLSISIHNGDREVVPDMGTSAYGVPDFTEWYRKTVSHTTLVVDEKDQLPAEGKLMNFNVFDNGSSAEAVIYDAYPGVEMFRSLRLEGNKLTDVFKASSEQEHNYDYVLILTDKPSFNKKGTISNIGEAPGYSRISGTEIRKYRSPVTIETESLKLTIDCIGSKDFEIWTGEAPGIPPRNKALAQNVSQPGPCYPVIIRTKTKNMNIKTEWRFK